MLLEVGSGSGGIPPGAVAMVLLKTNCNGESVMLLLNILPENGYVPNIAAIKSTDFHSQYPNIKIHLFSL